MKKIIGMMVLVVLMFGFLPQGYAYFYYHPYNPYYYNNNVNYIPHHYYYNPVNYRSGRIWVPEHLNRFGQLIPGHWRY